ncbi:hypothetical protein FRC12_015504 [Ceratobasidium sp. 428]|nr:hypothetical protein FRC12_015504 [Ceratobasidium sp. 428]
MNRLRRKLMGQQNPTKSNASEPGRNLMYPNTLIDPAQPQPPFPYAHSHLYAGSPGQGVYFQHQPGMILVPMNVVPTATTLPQPNLGPARPYITTINTAYDTERPPHGANISTPLTPHPSSPPSIAHEDHLRSVSNSTTLNDPPLSPVSNAGSRGRLQSPPSNKTLLMSDLTSLGRAIFFDLSITRLQSGSHS